MINHGEEARRGAVREADQARQALAYRMKGSSEPMDTIKDNQRLDALAGEGPRSLAQRRPHDHATPTPPNARDSVPGGGAVRRVLALGCHSDDIEIGCGATLLALTREPGPRSR